MCHRPDDGDATTLLQGEGLVVVLEQDDGLLVDGSRELDCLRAVDQLVPFGLRSGWVGVLEEAHFELGSENSGDGGVDDLDVQLAGLDELGDLLVVAMMC